MKEKNGKLPPEDAVITQVSPVNGEKGHMNGKNGHINPAYSDDADGQSDSSKKDEE